MTGTPNAAVKWTVVFLTLLAFAFRIYRLDAQSLWWDEVWTALAAKEPFVSMLDKVARDLQPPVYFILLFLWTRAAGFSDWAFRFFSVAFGVTAIPLMFAVGRRLAGSVTGLLAAFVASLSPFLVHYSQEVRGYSLVVASILLPTYFLLVAIEKRKARSWAIWAATALLATYTMYFALLVIGAQIVSCLALFASLRQLPWRSWLFASASVALGLLPWFLFRLSMGSFYDEYPRSSDLLTILKDSLVAFNLGTAVSVGDAVLPALGVFAMVAMGFALHHKRGMATLFLVPAVVVPVGGLYLISIIGKRDFAVRYGLVAYPAYILLMGLALDWLWQKAKLLGALATLGVAAISLATLSSYYFDYQFGRDDFRGAARYLDSQARDGDAIVFGAPWGQMAFDYYSTSRIARFGLPRRLPSNEQGAGRILSELAATYDRIWLVSWQDYFSDPDNKAAAWLDANATQMDARAFRLITLRKYRTAAVVMSSVPPMQNRSEVDFDNGMRLLGYDIDPSEMSSKGRIHITLYWQALRSITRSYNVYVKLINPAYHVWGQKDNRPVYDRIPTNVWKEGEIFRDEYTLEVLPGTPPGLYHLAIGTYDPGDWAAAKVTGRGTDHITVGPVKVSRVPGAPLFSHPKQMGFGNSIRFLGYDVSSDWRPDSSIHLTLFWQAIGPISESYTIFTHLVDWKGGLASQKDSQPADGTYPTSRWEVGEMIRDQYDIEIPRGLSPGTYSLKIGVYDAATGGRLKLRDDPKLDSVTLTSFSLRP